MPIDRHRISRHLRKLSGTRGNRATSSRTIELLTEITTEIDRAAERKLRRASSPAFDPASITFDESLPVAARRREIADAINAHQVVVVCGETGSGKTTQLPKILLQCGRGVNGLIGHTQPRRIAARSVATRIASELGTTIGSARDHKHPHSKVGGPVGYSVRFTDRTSPDTVIRVMTDGILLAETARDRLLLSYDAVIIDEAHERSLNIDFLLGYLRTLLPRRRDLKLIITSATIDPKRFSAHFGDAPIIEVSGRTHPVEMRYRPLPVESEADEDDPAMLKAILDAVHETGRDIGGDTLVFLSGEREIREVAKFLGEQLPADHEILPLYARLSADEQNRVFESHTGRRIVLATNVAETSLTVPGIRSVIDPGLARINRYSPTARVQRLPIERISQASARQRAGRCGRISSGICIRLYSEADLLDRPAFTDPEILRSNLASVILQMKALRFGAIDAFPFIDAPRASSVRAGLQTLHELGAIDDHSELTEIGRRLSRLPIDPRFGRMILQADREHASRETLIIVSALAAQDPRLRPLDKSSLADAAHADFLDDKSDFLTYLKMWEWWQTQSAELSSNKLRRACEARFISFVRMREWADTHRQLHALAMAAGLRGNPVAARYEQIHRALLSGLLSTIGMKTDTYEYQSVSDRKFSIFPNSSLFKNQPRWVMAAEVVETTRLYARTVARIHPEWIESLAPHLIKRTYTAPHWNRASAHVEAHERITLRGLTIVPKRRVHFGRIDLPLARETFIQHALVEGEYEPPAVRNGSIDSTATDSIVANRSLIESVRTSEHKARRRDVLIGPEAMFAFYDARIPPHVCNGPSFEKWRRKAERRNGDVLRLHRKDIMRSGIALVSDEEFPSTIEVGELRFPLEYRHEPGHPDDGVTMIVPVEALRQVSAERLEWLVPGLLRERIAALIKTLPKSLRTSFVPVPEYAATIAEQLLGGEGAETGGFAVGVLVDSIARELDRSTGVRVPREAWRPGALPDHLRMNIRVLDNRGQTLASGRDLHEVRSRISGVASDVLSIPVDERFNRTGITHWDFDDLPASIAITRTGVSVNVYPAIVDEGTAVGVKVFDTAARAAHATRCGLRRLFALQVRDELQMHVEYLPGIDQMSLQFAPLVAAKAHRSLKQELHDLIVDRVFLRENAAIRSGEEFRKRLDAGWEQLWPAASSVADLVARILSAHHDVELRLTGASDNQFLHAAVSDIRLQLREMFEPGFLVNTPWRWLSEFPRFLNAIVIRLQKLTNAGVQRDASAMQTVGEFWVRFAARRAAARGVGDELRSPELDHFRWLIEELRVSLFAQELRTSVPISPARLEKAWTRI